MGQGWVVSFPAGVSVDAIHVPVIQPVKRFAVAFGLGDECLFIIQNLLYINGYTDWNGWTRIEGMGEEGEICVRPGQ